MDCCTVVEALSLSPCQLLVDSLVLWCSLNRCSNKQNKVVSKFLIFHLGIILSHGGCCVFYALDGPGNSFGNYNLYT